MSFIVTTATKKVLALRKRIRAVCGGTSASKTISILMTLIDYAQSVNNELVSIVSESYPHLKKGAIRDFKNIMVAQGYWDDNAWNATDKIYTFPTGTIIEFFSADQPGKVRGPRRDVLYVNECNNISYETYNQLEIRTKKHVWLDWNPVTEFWFYTEVHGKEEDVDFITLTYLDNEALDPNIVRSIEAKKHNKNWWQVYGLGQLGEVEGRIYTGWKIIDEIPHEARKIARGLDFGYTNDPTAIIDIYEYNGGLIFDEQIYRNGLQNKAIADILGGLNKPETVVYADSSEPKSIDEIRSYDVPILPATKGPGSVNQGIQYLQSIPVSVTKRSVNLIKEYRNYLWLTDREGKHINTPQDFNNHALDACRYGVSHRYLRENEDDDWDDWDEDEPIYDEIGL